ncbi:ABC transporter ATP-binding protein [Streptomyces sp. NPDC059459]|uniref:ABC transporter ATP-binding protein n=1 Tax=Streptomyces sp. NPDC059459 TaxID=3346839 RepID=UPI00368335A4
MRSSPPGWRWASRWSSSSTRSPPAWAGRQVVLDGTDLAKPPEARLTRVRSESTGFVFQSFNRVPAPTAQENVETALVPLGVKARERREKAAEALESVGLGERLGHLPGEMSGGQRQRVAIARALVKQPKVLLADEPTGNLDESMRDEIMAVLDRRWEELGLTFVMVTHDSAITRKAPRLATLRKGRITVTEKTRARSAGRANP